MDASPLPTRARPGLVGSNSTNSRRDNNLYASRNPFSLSRSSSSFRSNTSNASGTSNASSNKASGNKANGSKTNGSKTNGSKANGSKANGSKASRKAAATSTTGRSQPPAHDDIEDSDLEEEDGGDDEDEDDDDDYENNEDNEDDEDNEDEEDEEDEEDDADELAAVGGIVDSPYFTQPTQPITQPTQVLRRPPTTLRDVVSIPSSSSPVPAPRSIVEVPASSPMQSPVRPAPAGRIGSLMAPAGTVFRAPAAPAPAAGAVKHAPPPGRGLPPQRQQKGTGDSTDEDDDNQNVVRVEDSSDDAADAVRGDIRPSSFHRQKPSPPPAAVPAAANNSSNNHKTLNDRKVAHLVTKMQSLLRRKDLGTATAAAVSSDACRAALLRHNFSVDDAVADVFERRRLAASAAAGDVVSSPPAAAPARQARPQAKPSRVPDMIRSFAYQANVGASGGPSHTPSGASTPGTPSSQQSSSQKRRGLSPSPRPKRRRLVQGRKYRGLPSSQPEAAAVTKALSDDDDDDDDDDDEDGDGSPPVVLLSDDDDDEDDDMDAIVLDDDDDDLEDEDDGNDVVVGASAYTIEKRVLKYFNTCTVDDLVAMLGAKARSKAETILSNRPFRSRAAVTRIQSNGGGGGGSRGRKTTNIGEDIFDAVHDYVVALQAIDVVVAQCEQKGLRIRSTLHRWNVDLRGSSKTKTDGDGGGDGDGLLTPSSDKDPSARRTEYVPLPIPQEPVYMRGHCTMKGYQLYGLNWLWELYQRRFGCILADDMGLGKTCQVISFLSHLVESYPGGVDDDDNDNEESARPWPNLVIVPPSTLANWKAEFKKFAPAVRVTTYSGSVTERDAIYLGIRDDPSQHHVVLTSYSQLSGKQDLDAMRRLAPHVAIFDEGHKMKNAHTALYRSLRRIDADWRLILTGTPVQNNLMEMINLLNFIQPSLFERHLEKLGALFGGQRFTLQDVGNGALLFSDRVRRARSILEPFILQRRKEQVLASMPKKTSRVVYCELDAAQKPIYEQYERQFRKGSGSSSGGDDDKAAAARKKTTATAVTGLASDQNNVWVQLRKAAIHAQLFRRHYDDAKVERMAKVLMAEVPQAELRQPELKHLVNELRDCSDFELHTWCRDYAWCLGRFALPEATFLQSGKVQALLALLAEFRARGDRALVFTRFARVLNILRECLAHAGVEHVSLEGATRVEERQAIIDEYTANPSIAVFLLTTGSGGTGINLTAANKVVIFDQSDNPQDDVQAENRAHRLGQTRDVEVIKLVTRHTIEELVYRACQTKLELAQRVTAGSSSFVDPLADGDKVAKAVEAEVRSMLLAQGTTPPKSDGE